MNLLRRIPDREIIYLMPETGRGPKEYHGRLVNIYWDRHEKRVHGDFQLESNDWGVMYPHNDIPYGKDIAGCWFFKNPSEEVRDVMKELGHFMTLDEMIPAWQEPPPAIPEPDPSQEQEPVVDPAFAHAAIEEELDKHREHKNGATDRSSAKRAGISGKSASSKVS